MKTIHIVVVLAILAMPKPAVASNGPDISIPMSGFASFEEMGKWSKTSTCCGGWSERLAISEDEIHWSIRSFTSGRATTEIVFWGKSGERIIPRLIIPLRFGEYKVEPKKKSVVIKRYEGKRGLLEVMTVDVAFFTDAYVFGKPRPDMKTEGEPP